MRKVGLAVVAVLALSAAACSESMSDATPAPPSCDLGSSVEDLHMGTGNSDAPIVASVTSFSAMSDGRTVSLLTLRENGDLSVLGDDDERHQIKIAPAIVSQVRQCVDESGFLDLEDGFTGATSGTTRNGYCGIADANELTVTAVGSSGASRTAKGLGPAFQDSQCDLGYPAGLVNVHAALEQLRVAAGTE